MNVGKTKVMISGQDCGEDEKTGKWPCAVCGKGVGRNSIQCTKCDGWVHKRCSGVKGSLSRASASFVCNTCKRGTTRGRSENDDDDDDDDDDVDLGGGVSFGKVKKFCYLGDMMNGEGGANSATITRMRCAWAKFRELSGILTAKEVSLKLKGNVYSACAMSAMIYGCETWATSVEQVLRIERTEMRMVRWMCGVSLRERKTSAELRQRMGIEDVGDVMKRSRLRWMGHVLRKDEDDWVRKSMLLEVDGKRGRGRPKITWIKMVERDMRERGLVKEDALDLEKWRRMSW